MRSPKKPERGRLLILGTHWELAGLVKKARAQGLYVVVCDAYPDGLARKYADMDYVTDVKDISAVAAICRRERIDHILTSFSDLMFECMAKTAQAAGLPCYIRPEMLPAYRNKEVGKELCRDLGIRVPAFVRLGRGFSEADIRSAGISYPALLKPVDSYGSRGMHIVRSVGGVKKHFEDSANYSGDCSVLLEEWSAGQEINIHGFIADGELTVITAADRKTSFWSRDTIPALYGIVYPAAESSAVLPKAQALLAKFIEKTGQKWGPVAMQCFWDGQELTVCEITGRMLAFEHELIEMTTGLDAEQLLLDMCYDKKKYCEILRTFQKKRKAAVYGRERTGFQTVKQLVAEPGGSGYGAVNHEENGRKRTERCASLGLSPVSGWKQRRYAEGLYIQNIRSGIIADMQEIRNIAFMEKVTECTFFYHEGEEVKVPGPKQYFARAYVQADTLHELLDVEKKIFRRCHVRNTEGDELLFVPSEIF